MYFTFSTLKQITVLAYSNLINASNYMRIEAPSTLKGIVFFSTSTIIGIDLEQPMEQVFFLISQATAL